MREVNFDKLVVGELSVNLMQATPLIEAKCAFVNTKNGATYGSTMGTQWSATTIEKLKELCTAMENDLEKIYFSDSVSATTKSGDMASFLSKDNEPVPQG